MTMTMFRLFDRTDVNVDVESLECCMRSKKCL